METDIVSETKHGKTREAEIKTSVFATIQEFELVYELDICKIGRGCEFSSEIKRISSLTIHTI
jgi:hypothetical protein